MTKTSAAHEEVRHGLDAYTRRLEKALSRLIDLENIERYVENYGFQIEWLKINYKGGGVGEYMVICKVLGDDGGPLVCFEGASSPVLALDKMLRKLKTDECRWKVDEYHGSQGKS